MPESSRAAITDRWIKETYHGPIACCDHYFGLIFVVTASLGNGLSVTVQSIKAPLKGRQQSSVMLLIGNFIILPALLIGLAAILPFPPQVKMAIAVLAINGGAPFIPWLVSLAKGDLCLQQQRRDDPDRGTIIILPLALPVVLSLLGTGATPSTWLVLWPLLLFMVFPLLVGMFIRARYLKLAMDIGPYLGPVSIAFLVVHIVLFLGYSWKDVTSLAGGGVLAFALVFPWLACSSATCSARRMPSARSSRLIRSGAPRSSRLSRWRSRILKPPSAVRSSP